MMQAAPVTKDLVLLGGGHAHLFVLRAFAKEPVPGVRLTLVTRDVHTPYSGMLPGYLAGLYSYDECHIDLRPLAAAAGARIFRDEAVGLDREKKLVLCANRPPVPYDLLSIDIGSRPKAAEVPGATEHAIALKPIDRLSEKWEALLARIRASGAKTGRLTVVGGGAAGVEVALAVHHRLRSECDARITLVASGGILPQYPPKAGRIFERVMRERGLAVHSGRKAVRVDPGVLTLDDGTTIGFDACLWATQGGTQPWLAASGLACTPGGFLRVSETLRSLNDASVFAAGDVADIEGHPRPKAGVFAVRHGRPLADNLREALAGRRLERFRPQSKFLSIVSTGDAHAIAAKGSLVVEGDWVWRWKDRIDRRFMKMFSVEGMTAVAHMHQPDDEMRCRGCGAKVSSSVLTRVLGRLGVGKSGDVVVGLDAPDDAAVVRPPANGRVLVQTVDAFPSIVEDPYVFGRIAAVHALGDLHAMGATPRTALALATVALAAEEKMEDSLFQMMSGALSVLRAEGVALVGGHSTEGDECALGFSLEGEADEAGILRKNAIALDQALILTKPLGTGVLFAADMRRSAKGRWIDAALSQMQRSSGRASEILRAHGATGCTDVTGFGLAGHLLEMLKGTSLGAELDLAAIPFLDGALELAASGVRSTLHPANARAAGAFDVPPDPRDPRTVLLFDPQTAGGLLASVPPERAAACVQALRDAGDRAAIVGHIVAGDPAGPLRLRA